jgi:hypothetical protein
MQQIITVHQIQTIYQPNFLKIANYVTPPMHGPHLLLIMMASIFQYTAVSIEVNGFYVLNVTPQAIMHHLVVSFVMNTAVKIRLMGTIRMLRIMSIPEYHVTLVIQSVNNS